MVLGRVTVPVDDAHKLTGSYTAAGWAAGAGAFRAFMYTDVDAPVGLREMGSERYASEMGQAPEGGRRAGSALGGDACLD